MNQYTHLTGRFAYGLGRLDSIRSTRGMTREDAMTRAFMALEAIERNCLIIFELDGANADLTPKQADTLVNEAVKVIRQNS